ncbi:ADP-ribosylglycohydrolase family protein [Leptothermofonsia sp. ETS-13]|uniref:ADP-ribosylglycohydrolase family protein n=1 Tax=Leptothermofonsia sp. ETS-13 TaxID=3035696 RepID=UPI003B9E9FBA
MRYSLLSRFQGVLLGAALGEELGSYFWKQKLQQRRSFPAKHSAEMGHIDLFTWHPGSDREEVSLSQSMPSGWGKVALYLTEKLILKGGWQGLDLEQIGLPALTDGKEATFVASPGVTGADLAIATLPVALFFHDNEFKRRQALEEVASQFKAKPGAWQEAWAFTGAIAAALKEQLSPRHLIPQIVTQLQSDEFSREDTLHDFISKLEQTQTLLQEGRDLGAARVSLLSSQQVGSSSEMICLALYCSLSTPEDFRLALIRAARSGNAPQVCGLTGALMGAYNSWVGIPLVWRMADAHYSSQQVGGVSGAKIEQLATRLLAVWSGVYNSVDFPEQVPAIAAPGVIRLS